MRIVIAGAGSIGIKLAEKLIENKMEVALLENDQGNYLYANEHLDCKVELASGTNAEALQALNLDNTDFFIALMNSDEANLAAAFLVGTLSSKPTKIIRICNQEYESISMIKSYMGEKTLIIHPPIATAEDIIKKIEHGAAGCIAEFFGGEIQLRSFILPKKQAGKKVITDTNLQQLRDNYSAPFLIPLYRRESVLKPANAETIFQEDDTIYIVAEQEHIESIYENFGVSLDNTKIAILGSDAIAMAIGSRLLEEHKQKDNEGKGLFASVKNWLHKKVVQVLTHYKIKYTVKYIVREPKRGEVIKSRLPDAEVIEVDASKEDLFEDADVQGAQIFIAASHRQELNIVAALYAKKKKVDRAIVLMRTEQMDNVANCLGLDVIVNTNTSLVDSIMHHIANKSHIQTIDGDMKAIKIAIGADSEAIGKSLQEVELPGASIIACVYRAGEAILPNGKTILQREDLVLILGALGKTLRGEIEKYFSYEEQ